MTADTSSSAPATSLFEAADATVPVWVRALHAGLPVAGQFVIHGSIRDNHLLVNAAGQPTLPDTIGAIWEVLSHNGFDALLVYDQLDGLRVLRHPGPDGDAIGQAVQAWIWAPDDQGSVPTFTDFEDLNVVIGKVGQRVDADRETQPRVALVLDYVSQARSMGDGNEALGLAMLASLHVAHRGRVFVDRDRGRRAIQQPIIWLVDVPNDLPSWMLSGDGVRQIPIGLPELGARTRVARVLVGSANGGEADERVVSRFVAATEGMTVRGMTQVHRMAGKAPDLGAALESAARAYRMGVSENPWRDIELVHRLRTGREQLEAQVKGQSRAVGKALDVLVRSAVGLTAAHQKKPGTGPRGVLYFAGPTGVGKTELAKAIADLVFADRDAVIRFDMSEFAHESAQARLIGSPPGFIGHGTGGELTNAIRRRPFSVVLFDEIDKAAPRILDSFLQILSDGRLTDGSGDTVYFTEAVIIFTSNQGVTALEALEDDVRSDPELYEQTFKSAIEHFFTEQIGRPELLGRIGDNIVVFQPIEGEVARDLANGFVDNAIDRIRTQFERTLQIEDGPREQLIAAMTRDLSKGGRGIALAMESILTNPLSQELFNGARGGPIIVEGVETTADGDARAVFER